MTESFQPSGSARSGSADTSNRFNGHLHEDPRLHLEALIGTVAVVGDFKVSRTANKSERPTVRNRCIRGRKLINREVSDLYLLHHGFTK